VEGKEMPDNDPRVFFAAERTLLAWIRTALGLIGMGFVVAKFGLFLRLVQPSVNSLSHPWSGVVGVTLAVLGAIAAGAASWQHHRFCRTLGPNEIPPRYSLNLGLFLGFGVAFAGVVLSVVIAV
jgi:putative membrane protein